MPSYFSKDLNSLEMLVLKDGGGARVPSISELVERIDTASKDYPLGTERFKVQINPLRMKQKASSATGCTFQIDSREGRSHKYEKVVVIEFGARKEASPVFMGKFLSNSRFFAIRVHFDWPVEFSIQKDAKMKHEGASVKRIFIDIKDLDLEDLLAGYDKEKDVLLWISKHLWSGYLFDVKLVDQCGCACEWDVLCSIVLPSMLQLDSVP